MNNKDLYDALALDSKPLMMSDTASNYDMINYNILDTALTIGSYLYRRLNSISFVQLKYVENNKEINNKMITDKRNKETNKENLPSSMVEYDLNNMKIIQK